MAKLTVLKWPDEALKTKAREVEIFDQDLAEFVSSMHETMQNHTGCICLIFHNCVFSNVSSNGLLERM